MSHICLKTEGLVQARSQDLEKGGGGLKKWEKCKRPWPQFSLFLNQFHTVCPKIETKFLVKLGNSKVFSAQNQVVSKKKKKKVFTEIETDFSVEIGNSNVFSAQNQVVSKEKKKKKSEIQTFEGGLFSYGGGLFSTFHKKLVSKAPKTCDFAYFTSQWGGSSPFF